MFFDPAVHLGHDFDGRVGLVHTHDELDEVILLLQATLAFQHPGVACGVGALNGGV